MSSHVSSEQVCYVHCNFCNTVLVVNVPCVNPFNIVTVRCGHCANLLSVNLGAMLQKHPFHDLQNQSIESQVPHMEFGSSSRCTRISKMNTAENIHRQMLPVRTTSEKRQRVPSAYNKFIKEEIRRLKAINPEISHREAFSAAAKNWAHFPRIHFGLSINGNKQV